MQVKNLIFDLDNTLYPAFADMDKGINERMIQCVQEFFNTSTENAIELKKKNIGNFSTTLEWLRSEGLTDVEGFFAKVHPENEANELPFNPEIKPLLESLKMPKIILTNAPEEHAVRVLDKLGVKSLFDGICDIRKTSLSGKPYPDAYKAALTMINGKISDTLFFDDMIKYTDGFVHIGGTAVLVGPKNGKPLEPNAVPLRGTTLVPGGRTFKINSIMETAEIIKKIESL